jgi:hypothetical protein
MIQRWFLSVTGTLLLTLSALYTTSLQNSANWVQQQVAPFFGVPDAKPSGTDHASGATSPTKRSLSAENSDFSKPQSTSSNATPGNVIDLNAAKATTPSPSLDGDVATQRASLPPQLSRFMMLTNLCRLQMSNRCARVQALFRCCSSSWCSV